MNYRKQILTKFLRTMSVGYTEDCSPESNIRHITKPNPSSPANRVGLLGSKAAERRSI